MAQIYNSQLDAFDLYHLSAESQQQTRFLDGPALPAIGHALAGAAGSAVSNVAVYPLDLIITRLQIQRQLRKSAGASDTEHYASIVDAARKIYQRDGGLAGLYAGVREDTAKSVADAFLFFLGYNFLRQLRVRRLGGGKQLPALDELSVGFAAGALSKLLTTPIANVVTRLQTASMTSQTSKDAVTATAIARQIRAEKGWTGFWSGYSASLVLTLNPSLTFFFFETLKRLVLPRASREHPPPSATFLLAAFSKAMASSITYPFSLAKARAQVSSSKPAPSAATKDGPPAASKRAAQTTVFAAIASIARTEGPAALYEGLGGEVLKGFFSHGITMLVKEAAHVAVIRLYYIVLKLLRRYPSPEEIATQARARATALGQATRDQAQDTLQRARHSAAEVLAKAQDGAEYALGQAKKEAGQVVEQAQDGAARGNAVLQQLGQDAVNQAGEAVERVRNKVGQ